MPFMINPSAGRRHPQVIRCHPREYPQPQLRRVDVLHIRDGLEQTFVDTMREEGRDAFTLEEVALLRAWDAALLKAPHGPAPRR